MKRVYNLFNSEVYDNKKKPVVTMVIDTTYFKGF
ncbi:hypothetical protein USA300HOU_0227 [Staphylococcus aureus subsp. aureus USA300_TCH1516]|nr:hypothetical protein USA300HOU_0227 [Staphylococcus aureus subsp. aureus USA300_TCH1516]